MGPLSSVPAVRLQSKPRGRCTGHVELTKRHAFGVGKFPFNRGKLRVPMLKERIEGRRGGRKREEARRDCAITAGMWLWAVDFVW